MGILFAKMEFKAYRTDNPPQIDGKLDDPVWSHCVPYTNFKTFEPEFGNPVSEKTVGYCAYDAHNLYFAFKCYTTDPAKIKATISKRDHVFNEDVVLVVLDSYNDQQSMYLFATNAYGIQVDMVLNKDGNGNTSQDFVWESDGRITDEGYISEIKIPLQSIRFPEKEAVQMGLTLARQIVRTSEKAALPEFEPGEGSLISQMGMVTYKGLKYQRTFELLPSITHQYKAADVAGNMETDRNRSEAGLTAKLGLTSTLTLDAAINPDFSQVEADAGQVDVNLRYNIFYNEKRPFFLEGKERFEFAGTGHTSAVSDVVYTRRIIDPLAGVKVSGKMGIKNALSSILAIDKAPQYKTTGADKAYFGIVRYQRILKAENYIGGILTSRETAVGFNRVGGLDYHQRLSGKSVLEANILYATHRDSLDQPVHSAHNADIQYNYGDKHNYFSFGLHSMGKKFNLASGWVPRDGISAATYDYEHQFYMHSDWLYRLDVGVDGFLQYDAYFDKYERCVEFNLDFSLPRSTFLNFDYDFETEIYADQVFDASGLSLFLQSNVNKFFTLYFNTTYGGQPYYDPDDPYQGDEWSLYAETVLQPTQNFTNETRYIQSVFYKRPHHDQVYNYRIYRNKTTYQINKYLFLRAILEYNAYYDKLTTDFLISFTYIPGTVIHLGYGSLYEKVSYDPNQADYIASNNYKEMLRGVFFKASYNWRF